MTTDRYATDTTDADEEYAGPSATSDTDPSDEAPASAVPSAGRKIVRGGWANARKQKAASSPFPQALKPTPQGVMVKFLEDGPYTTFRQHWINEIKEGQKAFTCLDGVDPQGCPLCDADHRATPQFQFNVALLGEPGDAEAVPQLMTYNVGPTVFEQLSEHHSDPRQGPLERHYWVIKRSKNGNKWTTTLFMQKEDDLTEQGIRVPTDEELSALNLWDEKQVRWTSHADLVEIAETHLELE